MKNLLLALSVVAVVFSGCKKCFTCTYAFPCSYCHYPNGTSDPEICDRGSNHQDYLEAHAQCTAVGAMWMETSSPDSSVRFCSKSKSEINAHRTTCEHGNGVWTEGIVNL
jgi:hypothetical protein